MPQTNRERFQALLDAKRQKANGDTPHDHDDHRRAGAAKQAKVKQTFKQRKV